MWANYMLYIFFIIYRAYQQSAGTPRVSVSRLLCGVLIFLALSIWFLVVIVCFRYLWLRSTSFTVALLSLPLPPLVAPLLLLPFLGYIRDNNNSNKSPSKRAASKLNSKSIKKKNFLPSFVCSAGSSTFSTPLPPPLPSLFNLFSRRGIFN